MLKLTKALVCSVLALTATLPVYAKDYGVQGQLYTVIERDFRQLLLESASRADWGKVQKEAKDSAENFLERLPQRYLPEASKTATRWIDPSVTLSEDIKAPVKNAAGLYEWRVLYPKGTRVNPMERLRPGTAFLLFDGSRPEQLEFIRQVLAREPDRFIPVEAGAGKIPELNALLKRPVFHANEAMIARFGVRELPSLVHPGSGTNAFYIGVTSFGPPLNPQAALSLWPVTASGSPLAAGARQ